MNKKTFKKQLKEILNRAWKKTPPPQGMDDVMWEGYVRGVTTSQSVFITQLVLEMIGEDESESQGHRGAEYEESRNILRQELRSKLLEEHD